MLLAEYIKYSVTKELMLDPLFIKIMFSLPVNNRESKYFKIENNKYLVKLDDRLEPIDDITTDRPIFILDTKVKIDPSWVVNIDKPIVTTLGLLLFNYTILVRNFKNKVPYIEKDFSISKIENDYIAKLLVNDTEITDTSITIDEYIAFVDSCKYVESWADVLVVSATLKSILPPPDLNKEKKKIIKDIKDKHGEDALDDLYFAGKVIEELQKLDNEFMKDDPSYGIVTTKKIMEDSRSKMFLSMGSEAGFNGTGKFVENSLYEGWPTDEEELASIFNSIRSGSYSRGVETQDGGLLAKILLRATNYIKIMDSDCKTKDGKEILVTEDNYKYLAGRRLLKDNNILTEEDTKKLISKKITIRSPQYCIEGNGNFCKMCVSKGLSTRPNGIAILITDIGSTILYISMKKMHVTSITIVPVTIADIAS